MDVTSIAALATEMTAAKQQQAISMAVMKMALDQQGSAVQALVQASAESSAQVASAIEGLGENIDVFV